MGSTCVEGSNPSFSAPMAAPLVEGCRSGRTGQSRKLLGVQASRGFKSLPLRPAGSRHRDPVGRQARMSAPLREQHVAHLLILWDGSAASFDAIRAAGDLLDARRATLLHLSSPPPRGDDAGERHAHALLRAAQVVQEGVALASRCGIEAVARLESAGSEPVDAILEVVRDERSTAIVVGIDAEDGTGAPVDRLAPGLLRLSPVPVLFVPGADPTG